MLVPGSPSLEPFGHFFMLDHASRRDVRSRPRYGRRFRFEFAIFEGFEFDRHVGFLAGTTTNANWAQKVPRRRSRDNAKGKRSNGRRPVHGARTRRAWLRDLSCERRTGNRTKPSIRPCGSGRRRGGLASCPSDRGGIPPVGCAGADRARSRCPSAFAALAACEHRPSSGSEKRSANRLRTRCERASNRYGDKCQGCSPDQNT